MTYRNFLPGLTKSVMPNKKLLLLSLCLCALPFTGWAAPATVSSPVNLIAGTLRQPGAPAGTSSLEPAAPEILASKVRTKDAFHGPKQKLKRLPTRHKYGSRPAEGVPPRECIFAADLPLGKSQVHASTLAALEDGTLVCAAFCGSGESHKDVRIIVSRKVPDGSWSEPRPVSENDGHPHWNPVLYELTPGILSLMYKKGVSPGKWTTLIQDSADGGVTWSAPRNLVPEDKDFGRGPVKNKLLTLADGRILAPGSSEKGSWRAYVDYSDDQGKTWTRTAFIPATTLPETGLPKRGVIQPSLWQDPFSGDVHMLLRSSEGRIFRSDSKDNGSTWSKAYPTDLPNNNSGLDLVQDPDNGILYLVCNPIVDVTIGTKRSPLSLLYSRNEGTSWFKMCDLETGPREFSYPAVIMQDGSLVVAYTYKRVNIAVRTFTPVQLAKLRFSAKPFSV
jgi:predicted neuraminidase